MRAAIPSDEEQRLAALRRHSLLDTPDEPEFDAIVRLARQIAEVPVALVSLVDAGRQWFKARVGLDLCETPRDHAICAHVVVARELIEIGDTWADPRTADNPLCLGPDGFRFYAGAPLMTDEGDILGTLCVLDRKPRTLSPAQREGLRLLARQVMIVVGLRSEIEASAILRKEIDHRVKNSLATVGGMVALEQRRATTEEARDALGRVAGQIGTVAALHEQLGKSTGDDRVAIDEYLGKVIGLLAATNSSGCRIDAAFAAAHARPDQAAALATVVNELVANAAKHGSEGAIVIRSERDGAHYRLICRNPIDSARETGDPARRRLGMDILRALSRQLGGELSTGIEAGEWVASVSAVLDAGKRSAG